MQLIRGRQNLGEGKQVNGVDLDRGYPFEQGLGHQAQWFPEFLLPCGKEVLSDPDPCVCIVHHPGHTEGLEGSGFSLETNMSLVIEGSCKASPALHGEGGSLSDFPLVVTSRLHP